MLYYYNTILLGGKDGTPKMQTYIINNDVNNLFEKNAPNCFYK